MAVEARELESLVLLLDGLVVATEVRKMSSLVHEEFGRLLTVAYTGRRALELLVPGLPLSSGDALATRYL